jgi:hypothetical protein
MAREAGEGGTPEQKLRAYMHVFLQRVAGSGFDSWIHQLMAQEMMDPTPALDMVADQVIRPRLLYVGNIIGELLGRPAEDDVVRRCVLSIQAQCTMAIANPLSQRLVPGHHDAATLERLADHITDFSLGGVRAVREATPRPARAESHAAPHRFD